MPGTAGRAGVATPDPLRVILARSGTIDIADARRTLTAILWDQPLPGLKRIEFYPDTLEEKHALPLGHPFNFFPGPTYEMQASIDYGRPEPRKRLLFKLVRNPDPQKFLVMVSIPPDLQGARDVVPALAKRFSTHELADGAQLAFPSRRWPQDNFLENLRAGIGDTSGKKLDADFSHQLVATQLADGCIWPGDAEPYMTKDGQTIAEFNRQNVRTALLSGQQSPLLEQFAGPVEHWPPPNKFPPDLFVVPFIFYPGQ